MDAARRERRHHHRKAAAAATAGATGMAHPGGVGGAAGAAARAAYGDVFGGPPRFAAPFGAAPVDYAEVFGGVAATCSIPFLDLPPAAAVGGDDAFFACKGKGDYGEIFARFDFADFALPYEDLFGEPEPPAPEPQREAEVEDFASSSGSSRSSIYKESSHLEDEAHLPPQHYQDLDHAQHFNEHNFSPISFHSDTANQQFVMSYNKATDRRPDDLVGMTTYTVEPSREFVVDSCNLSRGPETNHVSRMDNGDIEKNPSSASMSARSPESDFAVEQKQQSPSWTPISGSVSANESHTDSHAARSNATPPDYAFLRVSDIDSQTETIEVEPSLRQQPKLLNRKESTAKRDIDPVNRCSPTFTPTTSNSNTPEADKKADANPTSASAAMKEAMDFAEARLKAAKELLERKGDSFKLRKKPSHHRSTRSTEIKAPVLADVDTSVQKLSVKKPLKEENNPEFSLFDKHKKLSASRLDHFEDSGKRVPPLEKPQQMMQRCTESCLTLSKLEKLGNWRSGDEYYELTGDDQKYGTDKATAEDDKCKSTSPITSLSNDKKSETEFSASDSDLERYEKLWEVNDGRDVGVKHANLKDNNTAPLGKDSAFGILETSTENTAHKEICNSNLEGLVTSGNAKECLADDECVELPSMMDTSTMLDSLKDTSGSLSEACSSGNHASDLRDIGNNSPKVSPVSATSNEHTNSKMVHEVPCDDATQCTSGINEQLQETPEVSRFQGSNIKSLILEELEGSYACDPVPRAPSTVEQDVETYGREKFSFTGESFPHNEEAEIKEVPTEKVEKDETKEKVAAAPSPVEQDVETYGREKFSFTVESFPHNEEAEIKEVPTEEVEQVETEEKIAACAHREECPEKSDITLENNNLAGCGEPVMLNVFEVASKLIKRDLDQEMQGSLGHDEVDSRKEERTNGFISDCTSKEADEIPLENIKRASAKEGSAHDNKEGQKSYASTKRGQIDVDAKCNTAVDEIGSESISGVASDSTTTTNTSKDGPTSSSVKYTRMQHSVQKGKSGVEETGNVRNVRSEGERELPTGKPTFEEKKCRANKMEETDMMARVSKVECGSSPLEKNHSLPKSAEVPMKKDSNEVSTEAMKKKAVRVQRAKERENATRAESANGKDKGSSQRTEEAKESTKRLQKEREAEERERRKLEEEERERERKKDRLAVERATREAHERAFAEAREKAEKMAFERITAARQRASAEAREKEERASSGAATERATREARIKAERAAVERATAEARERAIEKAKAEKALAEARERRERYRSSFNDRSTNQDVRQDTQFQRAASSNFTRNPDSSNKVVEVESALRHKARLERHQRTAERVTKALAEKNMRDLLAQREQAEKHRMSEFLDPEIKRWSNGKEGNLRALLSTLQYILGSDSGWQPVPLTDLITAVAVKKAYRKATLCVHPDKLQQRGATIRQKYICEKVFDLLKDAWNKFTSEER